MRLTLTQATALTFALAAFLAAVGAVVAANSVEKRTALEVQRVLGLEGYDWAEIKPDGLRIHLSGIAPTESARFRALTLAGQIIDSDRVIDEMGVTPSKDIRPPQFSIEILRTPSGLSAIGLIPAAQDRASLLTELDRAAGGADLTDLLETANYPVPSDWYKAVDYGLQVVADLPRSKVSITPGFIGVEAITDSERLRRDTTIRLREEAPAGVAVVTNLKAPRPAITPFVLRAVRTGGVLRFDACSAATAAQRNAIVTAAAAAGAPERTGCVVGLGSPSDQWGSATVAAIETLSRIGDGSVTFTNADVSLLAAPDVDAQLFETETAALARALPAPYTLVASIQPAKQTAAEAATNAVPEFQVIRSPEGHVRATGPMPDDLTQTSVESYIHSRFGKEHLSNRIEQVDDLPEGWPLRVLTGIEALSLLNHGVVTIQPRYLEITGTSGNEDTAALVTQLFGRKLDSGAVYAIDITYLETLDPEANKPSAQECVDRINTILAQDKITFAPSSVTIEGPSVGVVNKIAEAMQDCQEIPMEIGGHTDSQGREEMNQQLSQSRAEAVLNALLARRILTAGLTARGYGETTPIADNGTEEGREANRRIEFTLLQPEPAPEPVAEPKPAPTKDAPATAPENDAALDAAATPQDAAETQAEDVPALASDAPQDNTAEQTGATDTEQPSQGTTGPGSDAVPVARPSSSAASE